jgi:hypothetical protein
MRRAAIGVLACALTCVSVALTAGQAQQAPQASAPQAPASQAPASPVGPERPRIMGISHLALRVSDMAAAKAFYSGILGLSERPGPAYAIGPRQYVLIEPGLHPQDIERLTHLAFQTSDVAAMGRRSWARRPRRRQARERCRRACCMPG